jgi:hypothetical protein
MQPGGCDEHWASSGPRARHQPHCVVVTAPATIAGIPARTPGVALESQRDTGRIAQLASQAWSDGQLARTRANAHRSYRADGQQPADARRTPDIAVGIEDIVARL